MSPLSPYRFNLRQVIGLEGIPPGGTTDLSPRVSMQCISSVATTKTDGAIAMERLKIHDSERSSSFPLNHSFWAYGL